MESLKNWSCSTVVLMSSCCVQPRRPVQGMAAVITLTWHQEASRGMSSVGGGSSAGLGCSQLSAGSVRMLLSLQLVVWLNATALLRLSLLLPGGVLAAPAPVEVHSKVHKQG